MTRRLLVLPLLACLAACGTTRGPYAPDASAHRDIGKAEERYQAAVAVIAKDPAKAEGLLREALGLDLYHGGAHNNLGVLLLKQDRLYDAAEEFEWARKLLPGHPEPRTNLAIVLDRGGKTQEALEAAHAALEVRPGHLPAIEAIALIQVREGIAERETLTQLDQIVQRSDDPTWRDWARAQRLTLEGKLQP